MTKIDLIKLIQVAHKDLTQKFISSILSTIFIIIQNTIQKELKFTYPGFGTFVIRARKARMGRDPRSGNIIQIHASKTIGFKPSKAFKDKIQKYDPNRI